MEIKRNTKVWVFDESGNPEILHGDILDLLRKDIDGPVTHVFVGFYQEAFSDERGVRLCPIDRCYFGEIPMEVA